MSLRRMSSVGGLLIGMFCTAHLDATECIGRTPREMKRSSTRVLEGTILSFDRTEPNTYSVSVRVHRVWKGPVTKTAVFNYVRALDSAPLEPLEIGDRRVFFGEPWDDPTVLMLGCTGAPRPTPDVVKQLGRARTP